MSYTNFADIKHSDWTLQLQCDQIVQFVKVLGNKISSKISRNDVQLLGLFFKTSLLGGKYCMGYFLGNFWKKLGYFFLQHLVTLLACHIHD